MKTLTTHLSQLSRWMLLATSASLIACGGGSSSNNNDASGSFSLSLTDGPVDSANQVVVEFTGVSIKPADGEAIEFTFAEPRRIDLLQLQGTASTALLTDEEVPAGNYEWIRLHVNAEHDGVYDSFIELGDGSQLELRIPSGSQTGLKLVSGFTIGAGSSADFTIDFDLRKSVTNPGGQAGALLKPALRLINNLQVGSVAGTVDANLVAQECDNVDLSSGAVYIFTGADVTPVDMSSTAGPLTSALVSFGEDNEYRYEIGFVPAGSYTLAYTCDSASDVPDTVEALTFVGTSNISVVADQQTSHNFVLSVE